MKNFVFVFVSLLIFNFVMMVQAEAVTTSPSSGSFPSSQNKVINLKAAPPGATGAVQIRLTVNNARVLSYSGPGEGVLAIGSCDVSGASYRAVSSSRYEVCVDLATTAGNFSNGTSLGSLTLKSLSSAGGSFTITADSDNGYLMEDNSLQTVTGTLGTYTFAASNSNGSGGENLNGNNEGGNDQVTPTTPAGGQQPNVSYLPNTGISDYMPGRGILGGAILISGVVSFVLAIKVFLIDKRKSILE